MGGLPGDSEAVSLLQLVKPTFMAKRWPEKNLRNQQATSVNVETDGMTRKVAVSGAWDEKTRNT
jgi:hypothetical protein